MSASNGTPPGGTPRELLPITEKVLAFVARVRKTGGVDLGDLRRIELCALATREACYFHDLYGSAPSDLEVPGEQRGRGSSGEHGPLPHPCVRCEQPTTRYIMGTAEDRPTYVCDLWPHCQET